MKESTWLAWAQSLVLPKKTIDMREMEKKMVTKLNPQ